MQVIIYGKGKVFQRYKDRIDWSHVIAIADRNAGYEEQIEGKKVIKPQEIQKLQYDYIVIFSDALFFDIRRELVGEYFISSDRLVSWRFLIQEECELDTLLTIKDFIKALNIKSMLDTDMSLFPGYTFSVEEIILDPDFVMDGVGSLKFSYYKQIYRDIYSIIDDVDTGYDLIYFNNELPEDVKAIISDLNYKYVLVRMSYVDYSKEKVEKFYTSLRNCGNVKKIYLVDSVYLLLCDKRSKTLELDAKIYVVTHREYNLMNNELYMPICVGDRYENDAFLSEKKGENISYLNEKINECTALYWIWKNTSCKHVGLNHYRRYFYSNEILADGNYLNQDEMRDILQEYDMILPKYILLQNRMVQEQISLSISEDAFERGYQLVREGIASRQPDYLDAFDTVMKGQKVYLCNMFITRREILNEYCEWLFSFLIDVAEKIDVSEYDSYSKRVIGFFAERMMTVWLLKHNFKIKELPFDIVK